MEAVTSTTVSPSSTTTASPTTTTVPGTSSTQAVLPIWSRPVFVYESPEASFTGNPALVPIWVDVTAPGVGVDSEFTAALAAMGAELPEPFQNAIPSDVEIVSLTTGEDESGAHWLADMNDAFSKGAGGLLADYTMLNQLIYTITQGSADFPEVLFTVNGEPVTEFGTEGLDLTGPVDRSSFIDELSLIFLTEPIIEVENVYVVSGMANTFEASLSVRVVDGAGATVHEVPVMATCGSGCWGEFGVGITSDLIVPGESSIQLFTYSAQDGSMTDVITIPVPVGGSWQVDLSTDTP
jgi:hypothetical protein